MLEKITIIVAAILGIIMTLYGLYYIFIALYYFKERIEYPETDHFNKFAILVPARNEGQVIGQLIGTLKAQNYPKDMYDIVVMPNNCTDDTEEISRQHGAIIFKPQGKITNKGQVLNQCFDYLLNNFDHDGFLVFDADNLVDANYLKEMNKALDAGYQVATGFRDSSNPTVSYISSAYAIYYLLASSFYNQARSNLGMNSLITGTGFMTSRKALESLGGWNTCTLTEDVEFTLQNSIQGNNIAFVEKAITYDQQPENFKQAWNQRLRWSIGSQQGFKLMHKQLLLAEKNGRGKDTIDMFMMLLITYMQTAGFIVGIIAIIASSLVNFWLFISSLLIIGLGSIIIQTIMAIAVLKVNNKPIGDYWMGIISFWWFTLSWIPIHTIAMTKDTIEWKEIKHKAQTI